MTSFHRSTMVLLLLTATVAAQTPTTRPREGRRARQFESMLRLLGDVRPDDVHDLQRCIDLVRVQILGDNRLFPFEVRASIVDGKRAIGGYAAFPEQVAPVLEMLRVAGAADVLNNTATGPAIDGLAFGRIRSTSARVMARPQPPAENVTELSAGDPVYLLRQVGDRILCLGPEGYSGYVAAADIERIDASALASILNARPAPSEKIDPIIDLAMSFRGTPYVWGGTTAAGIDCSGLMQTAFKSQGVLLPRDADQQVYVGRLVGTRWFRAALRRGDLIFFMGRRGTITHVAMYVGDNQIIEAADGGVQVSSFDPDQANYRERRDRSFCYAKRVLE